MLETSAFMRYLKDVKRYSLHTLFAYEKDLSQFVEYAGSVEMVGSWDMVTPKMVRRWEVRMMKGEGSKDGRPLSPRTVRRKLSALSTFFTYMMRQGGLTENPVASVALPELAKKLPVYLEPYQMDELLDRDCVSGDDFHSRRDHLVLLMAYVTGMRRAELVALKVNDVDMSAGTILVNGKGSRQRIVPMTQELKAFISAYLPMRNALCTDGTPSFFVTDKGRPVYDKFIYRLVTGYLSMVSSSKKRSPHVLRHTFATALLNNGACIEAIRMLLGHTDLSATQVYTHSSVEGLKKIYNQAHPRSGSSGSGGL